MRAALWRLIVAPAVERDARATHASACCARCASVRSCSRAPRGVSARGTATCPRPLPLLAEAIARDQAGLHALADLLDELPRAAARKRDWPSAGMVTRRVDHALLEDEPYATATLPPGGGRGAAVRVLACASLPALAPRVLVLAGAEEGTLPLAVDDDPILSDETRRVLERAIGRELSAAPASEEARARLAIASACASAAEIVLTWSRVDDAGSPRLRGAIVEDALARGAVEERGSLAMIPSLDEVRAPAELLARLGAETHATPSRLRPSARERVRESLRAWSAERVAHVERASAIERGRARFFAGDAEANVFDGRLADAAVRAALRPPLPGGTRALSATTLARFARVPAPLLSRRRVATSSNGGTGRRSRSACDRKSSSPRARAFVPRVDRPWSPTAAQGRRPRSSAHIDAVVAEPRRELGHAPRASSRPRVAGASAHAAPLALEALWRKEVSTPAAPGFVPTALELSFDGLRVDGVDGEEAVLLGGRIRSRRSRARGRGRARRGLRLQERRDPRAFVPRLKDTAFADTSWQLPILRGGGSRIAARRGRRSHELLLALRNLEIPRRRRSASGCRSRAAT